MHGATDFFMLLAQDKVILFWQVTKFILACNIVALVLSFIAFVFSCVFYLDNTIRLKHALIVFFVFLGNLVLFFATPSIALCDYYIQKAKEKALHYSKDLA